MIVRDNHGIIVQHSPENPNYQDGGDSLSRTGIMALCGSIKDQSRLWEFSVPGGLVRHPYQQNWKHPSSTSRDQVVCSVGTGDFPATAYHYAIKGKVNKDWLDPAVRLYLFKCADAAAPLWVLILGWPWLFLSLIWNTKIKPNAEMNQFACICIVMGQWWCAKLIEWHPDIYSNIMKYWSGWRDQPEIGWALTKKLYSTAGFIKGE